MRPLADAWGRTPSFRHYSPAPGNRIRTLRPYRARAVPAGPAATAPGHGGVSLCFSPRWAPTDASCAPLAFSEPASAAYQGGQQACRNKRRLEETAEPAGLPHRSDRTGRSWRITGRLTGVVLPARGFCPRALRGRRKPPRSARFISARIVPAKKSRFGSTRWRPEQPRRPPVC